MFPFFQFTRQAHQDSIAGSCNQHNIAVILVIQSSYNAETLSTHAPVVKTLSTHAPVVKIVFQYIIGNILIDLIPCVLHNSILIIREQHY